MRRLAALSLILAATCGRPIPRFSFKLPELHAKLDNGMRVIVLPDETTDLVEVDVRYEVGSNEDPPGKEGLAHLVEHLMFQQHTAGEDKPPLGALLTRLSVFYNAYTTNDTTHYMTVAKKEHFEDLISLEATRLYTGCNGIPQATFEREREVVRNEMRWRVGNPEGAVYYKLLADIFPEGHPYRREVGGDDESVSSITLGDVCEFMEKYYVPERATVVVAGNVTEADASNIIGKWMAALPKKTAAPRVPVPDFELKRKRVDHDMDIEETTVVVAWRLPNQFSEEFQAANFVFNVFGAAAYFGEEYGFATDVRPGFIGGPLAPVFYVQVSLRSEGKIDEAIDFIMKGARSSHRGLEEGEEFEELRRKSLADLAMSFESLGARTGLFADYAQFAPEAGYFRGEMDRIKRINGDRVRSIVKKLLDPDKAVIVVFHAKKDGAGKYRRANVEYGGAAGGDETREKFTVDPAEAYQSIVVPQQSTALSRAKTFQLANGLKVMLLPTQSSLPVVTTRLIFDVGAAHEPRNMPGLAEIAAQYMQTGVVSGVGSGYTSTNVFSAVGAQLRTSVTDDSTTFSVRGLNIYLDVMIKGLERLIKTSDYDQDSLERAQRHQKQAFKRLSYKSRVEMERVLAAEVYGADHPYAANIATEATVGRVGRDAAYEFKSKHYSAKNATIVVAGNFDPAVAEKHIRANFGEWSGGHDDQAVTALAAQRTEPAFVAVPSEDSATVTIQIAYPAPAGIDRDHATRLVLAAMMDLRMSAIRERLGSSYGTNAGFATRLGPGMYIVNGPVDANRAGESLVAMRAGIESLRKGENFNEDFVRARRLVLERLLANANESASLAAQLSNLALFDLPLDFYDTLVRKVANLAPEEVMLLIGKELKAETEVVVALGPADALRKAFADAGIQGARFVE